MRIACFILSLLSIAPGAFPASFGMHIEPVALDWTVRRAVLMARTDQPEPTLVNPVVSMDGGQARVVRVIRGVASIGSPALFLIEGEASGAAVENAMLRVSLDGAPEVSMELRPGFDLSRAACDTWRQPGNDPLPEPPGDADWRPAAIPFTMDQPGIQWLRLRFTIPEALREQALWLHIGAIDDADTTWLNGVRIGATTGWDTPRKYVLPADAIHYGEVNTLLIAIQNTAWGGGVYRAPMVITTDDAVETASYFAIDTQPETARPPHSPLGSPLPLRPMMVKDGVLYYQDGGEVNLWGVNYYPQSWTQYNTLGDLGVDRRSSIDEDLDDLVRMGVDVIRVHVFDTEFTDGAGNIIQNEHLALLDYIAAGCGKRGIYMMLTLMAWWGSPNELPDSFSRVIPKQAMTMWPEAWPIQARYIEQFLTHVNPETGRRLVDEPCLALFEIINEPCYWNFNEVRDGTPGDTFIPDAAHVKKALDGVASAWRAFAPDPAWRTPSLYPYFRYDTLREYINTMHAAIRATGARQPVAYFRTWWQSEVDLHRAVGDSLCEAVTFGAYPGGLPQTPDNDGKNILKEADDWEMESCFNKKARLIYEFDSAGTRDNITMYPALARQFRHVGVQVASQFQYDSRATAHLNKDWPQHYLNYQHTPERALSYMIAGEAFKRIPRGATFDTPPDDQVFAPSAVSFQHRTAILSADDVYMQATPSDWRPLPLPATPRRIVTTGSCPYFRYEGNGITELIIDGDTAALTLQPSVIRVADGLLGTPEKPLTRLDDDLKTFQMLLAGWEICRYESRQSAGWVPVTASADGSVRLVPGRYRIIKR